jgi:hypothetical protein
MRFEQVNYLVDIVMPKVKDPNAFKIVMCVARQTWGRKGKTVCKMSFSDFRTATGIVGKDTIKRAIDAALTSGFVHREKAGKSFCYFMSGMESIPDVGMDSIPTNEGSVWNPYHERYESHTNVGMESIPITSGSKEKENYKEGGDEETSLSYYFSQVTGCLPSRSRWVEDWELVLVEWEKRYGSDTQAMIDRAVAFARGKNKQQRMYTITSPLSLNNIMANLETEQESGRIAIGDR